ncbi:MAG: 16S rRNA (guanine(966)-N(2))-methyltransferase RsmD [Acidobacteria bacterium]|nr:MAG: 16S rRNA (guanine(966)-N(2))-methyltransferase RsmD [Acidobacteriota bacterium]
MRIISGHNRGQRIQTLKGMQLRPTSDQMRETLFDIIGPSIRGSTFLDAYAGSGAVGLEALSRGAKEVVFVEHHRAAIDLIRRNLAGLKVEDGFYVMNTRVLTALERLDEEGAIFDFVFLDPPYGETREYHQVLRQLGRSRLLTPASFVIAEHSRHYFLEEKYNRLERTRTIRHGDAELTFYRLSQAGAGGVDKTNS